MSEESSLLFSPRSGQSTISYSLPVESIKSDLLGSDSFIEINPDLTSRELADPRIYLYYSCEILCSIFAVSLGYVIEFLNPFISTYAIARLVSVVLKVIC